MTLRASDSQILAALAVAREQHPDLAPLLTFYSELYEVQFRAKAGMGGSVARDRLSLQARLDEGRSLLEFDDLAVGPEAFASLVAEIARLLVRHNPDWEMPAQGPTTEELMAHARLAFDTWPTLTPPTTATEGAAEGNSWTQQPLAAAVGLALAPYLQSAAEAIAPGLDLAGWPRGDCPICGGRPNLALLEAERGARRLLCARCDSLWDYSRVGCPFCGSGSRQTYFSGPDGVHRLYTCPDCGRYLKTVDLRGLGRTVLPAVERLLTVGMDLAARQQGYVD
jgi:hypothetical protein